jgi:hypothetical protein
MAGGKGKASLNVMTRAIARTIELTCSERNRSLIKSPENTATDPGSPYREFWTALFSLYSTHGTFPTLITFNYDLVLERSLVGLLTGSNYSSEVRLNRPVPFGSLAIDYHLPGSRAVAFQLAGKSYPIANERGGYAFDGYRLKTFDEPEAAQARISLLKLHGSLNFSKNAKEPLQLESAVDDPQILPPLFNKDTTAIGNSTWGHALRELSEAKNIVVVGYSLPQTDIYMQYFLRAALGPNVELNKITVFDPCLFDQSAQGNGLKRRYQECFSPQLQRRIHFTPDNTSDSRAGTTRHFVHELKYKPASMLFL